MYKKVAWMHRVPPQDNYARARKSVAILGLQVGGSRPWMSRCSYLFVAMSQPSAAQAISHAGCTTGYIAWAQHVRWDALVRTLDDDAYDNLPKAKHYESPQYDLYCRHTQRFRDDVEALVYKVSISKYVKGKDDLSLAADVAEYLPYVLHIFRQANALRSYRTRSSEVLEADKRHPIDMLGSLVWDIQSDGFMLERKLQIPGPLDHYAWVKPDACVSIPIHSDPALHASRPSPLYFPRAGTAGPECCFILYWVTEFERGHDQEASRRLVVEGIVSALYQRRAFGLPNRFVFGTAPDLRGTWYSEGWLLTPRGGFRSNENDPTKVLQQAGDASGGRSGADQKLPNAGTNRTTENIKKHNKALLLKQAAKAWLISTSRRSWSMVVGGLENYSGAQVRYTSGRPLPKSDRGSLYAQFGLGFSFSQQRTDVDAQLCGLLGLAKSWPP
ncbi:hypothetical protein B0J17DRAFT_631152 [Rhizoctonia solani]|nr:hypothetical protein B0J17DRAFT_631152 [Rhizoctonia solani]